jgi:hypothetical protein
MPTTKPKTNDPAAEAAAALERRRARTAAGLAPREVTPEELAIASAMRERDHREGCPAQAGRIEAYGQTTIAPGPELRALNVRPGDTVVVCRCHDCGMVRYFAGYADVDAFIDEKLEGLAGLEPQPAAEADLDGAI